MDMTLKDRLTAYLKYKGVNNSEFGRIVGVSNAYISSIRKFIQPGKMSKISENFPDLNMSWLMTGEGEMLRPIIQQKIGNVKDSVLEEVNVVKGDPNAYETLLRIVEANQKTTEGFLRSIEKFQEQTDRFLNLLEARG